MKQKLQFSLLSLSIILMVNLSNAQIREIWGVTSYGGTSDAGTVFKNKLDGSNQQVVHSFSQIQGEQPQYTTPCEASNGLLYGMTYQGGDNSSGIIFSFNQADSSYTYLFSFDDPTGSNPYGSLIQASDGLLYGMTNSGGSNNEGVIFSFDITSNTYTDLYDFDPSTTGYEPYGSLVQASNGLLYGMTQVGGINDEGVLFSFNPTGNVYSTLIELDASTTGSYPYGDLIQATDGLLYGMTNSGGANYEGVLFSYDITGNSFVNLLDFDDNTTGYNPYGSLVQATDGLLYGMTQYGGMNDEGVIFSYDLTGAGYTTLLEFDDNTTGYNPYGNLMQASNGLLYGMTNEGGSNNEGVVFSFNPTGSVYTTLHDFVDSTGSYPQGSLMQASNGLLYGLPTYGGLYSIGGNQGSGVLFSYDLMSTTYTDLADFNSAIGGYIPNQTLLAANNGLLYGVSGNGGKYNAGIMYSIDPISSAYTKILDFGGMVNGDNPVIGLIQANNGLIYGTTNFGPGGSYGTIYSFDIVSNTLTTLYDFGVSGVTGHNPRGLVQGNDGLLYGIAGGGANGKGVIFSFDITTNMYTDKFDFVTATGAYAVMNLVKATDGKLYGLTNGGGANSAGTLFSYDVTTSTYSDLYDFSSSSLTGNYPSCNLIQATNGLLFGFAAGGLNGDGLIFSYNITTSTYSDVYDFDGVSGSAPNEQGMLQGSDGLIYGTTHGGGVNDAGVIFSFDPAMNTYTKLLDFDGANGWGPAASLIEFSYCPAINNAVTTSGVTLSADQISVSYQWLNCDSAYAVVTGASSQSFSPTINGNYSVQLTQTNGCIDTTNCYAITTLGLNENSFANTLKLYPNPGNGNITIDLGDNYQQTNVAVKNLSGQLIQQTTVSNTSELKLSINGEAGVYFVEITTENQDRTVLRFVKE